MDIFYNSLMVTNFVLKWQIICLSGVAVIDQRLTVMGQGLNYSSHDGTWLVHHGNRGWSSRFEPVVQTRHGGKIQGKFTFTQKKRKIYAFLGVPYAEPPVGDLRFEPPKRLKPLKGTLNATKSKDHCLQLTPQKRIRKGDPLRENITHNLDYPYFLRGSEDCLYMNIYTPHIYNKEAKEAFNPQFNPTIPVVVYIHGGGFSFGGGQEYKPKYILDRMNVVFVTINYRLGPFGFLSTESSVVPGNMGLKDQVQALRWINEYIYLFGGDENNVSLLGMSAGGASVHYHYLSKLSRHHFKQGISMSGTALCPWALMERGKEKTLKLAATLKCENKDDKKMIDCLKKMPGRKILTKIKRRFMPFLYNPFTVFGPIVEKENTTDSFLDENPYDIIRKGNSKHAPWMVSVSSRAGLFPGAHFLWNSTKINYLKKEWLRFAPFLLDYNYTVDRKYQELISTLIKDQYIDFQISGEDEGKEVNFRNLYLSMLSDRLFDAYIGMAAKTQAQYNPKDVFFYKFDYKGSRSYIEVYSNAFSFPYVDEKKKIYNKSEIDLGVPNDDELIYAFGSVFEDLPKNHPEDYPMIDYMITEIWGKFLLFGRTIVDGEGMKNWDPVHKNDRFGYLNYLHIKSPNDVNMTEDWDFGKQHFWMTLNIDETLFWKKGRYFKYL